MTSKPLLPRCKSNSITSTNSLLFSSLLTPGLLPAPAGCPAPDTFLCRSGWKNFGPKNYLIFNRTYNRKNLSGYFPTGLFFEGRISTGFYTIPVVNFFNRKKQREERKTKHQSVHQKKSRRSIPECIISSLWRLKYLYEIWRFFPSYFMS